MVLGPQSICPATPLSPKNHSLYGHRGTQGDQMGLLIGSLKLTILVNNKVKQTNSPKTTNLVHHLLHVEMLDMEISRHCPGQQHIPP